MPATSRDLTLIDELVSVVDTAWTGQGANDEVSRQYLASVSEKELHQLVGRKVYFFPMAYETEDANRGENRYGYRVGCVVVERFEDADKATSTAMRDWLDTRLDFVETKLIDGLDYGQNGLLSLGTRRFWTESIEIPQRYDVELLAEKKLFRCDLGFMFRELA